MNANDFEALCKKYGLEYDPSYYDSYGVWNHPALSTIPYGGCRWVGLDYHRGIYFATVRVHRVHKNNKILLAFPRPENRTYIDLNQDGWEKEFAEKFTKLKNRLDKYYRNRKNREIKKILDVLE